jgi:large subunit ribosomal protein L19e
MADVRRIAARILGVGERRIRMLPAEAKRIGEALTGEDVRSLIKQGIVYAARARGVSRSRARTVHAKTKGRGGEGSRKGTRYSAFPRKRIWMSKTRAQRRALREAKATLKKGAYRTAYRMIKGRAFKSKAHLAGYLKEKGLITA